MDFLVYLICLGAGLVFAVMSAVLGHFFDAHHDGHFDGSGGHAEAGFDSGDMPGISAFSPTVIATFVTAFGGMGVILHNVPSTRNPWISAPLAVLGGLVVAACVLWLLRQLFRQTQGSSESKVATLIGTQATIITPIPANGVGEIAYVQNGTRYSAPARDESGQAIATGQSVWITRIVGSQFYVSAS